MRNHQIDLEFGESVRIDGYSVTVHRIDDDDQQAVLEIRDSDGSTQMVTVDVVIQQVEEPVLV
jgi:hypothetical protein